MYNNLSVVMFSANTPEVTTKRVIKQSEGIFNLRELYDKINDPTCMVFIRSYFKTEEAYYERIYSYEGKVVDSTSETHVFSTYNRIKGTVLNRKRVLTFDFTKSDPELTVETYTT